MRTGRSIRCMLQMGRSVPEWGLGETSSRDLLFSQYKHPNSCFFLTCVGLHLPSAIPSLCRCFFGAVGTLGLPRLGDGGGVCQLGRAELCQRRAMRHVSSVILTWTLTVSGCYGHGVVTAVEKKNDITSNTETDKNECLKFLL
jgi:hypothetical protein